MILSGPKDCLGSTKEVKILPHFLHSAVEGQLTAWGSGLTEEDVHAIDDGSGLWIPILYV